MLNNLQAYLYRVHLKKVPLRQAIELCREFEDPLTTSQLATHLFEDEALRASLSETLGEVLTPTQRSLSGLWVAPSEYDPTMQVDESINNCQRLDLNTYQLEPTPCELELPTLCMLSVHGF